MGLRLKRAGSVRLGAQVVQGDVVQQRVRGHGIAPEGSGLAVQGGEPRLEAGVSVTVAQIDGAVAVVAPVTTSTAAPAS